MSADEPAPEHHRILVAGQQALEKGQPAVAIAFFERTITVAAKLGDREAEMTAQAGLAMAHFGLGRPADALAPARRAAELAAAQGQADEAALFGALVQKLETDLGGAEPKWFAPMTKGQAALERGQIEEALPSLEEAARLAREVDATGAEATICSLLAQGFLALHRPKEALPHARRALAIAEQLGQTEAVDAFRKLIAATETAIERVQRIEDLDKG
ncbi:MAG: tetratricopeptide repeat protein [Myxococcales bacterium]|nr:tetratricopeptide repeat protein [Myxococcales bacterium]